MLTDARLVRFRVLYNHLKSKELFELDKDIAIVGECNLPCAHVVYFYEDLDYYMVVKTTKSKSYKKMLIDSHTEEIRQYTIENWLSNVYSDKVLAGDKNEGS